MILGVVVYLERPAGIAILTIQLQTTKGLMRGLANEFTVKECVFELSSSQRVGTQTWIGLYLQKCDHYSERKVFCCVKFRESEEEF